MRKERTIYSQEFKIKAVELSNERGSVNKAAIVLSIRRDSLRHWKREYNAGKFNSNGSFKGKLSKDNTYIWKIKLTNTNGQSHEYEGTVTLIK